MRRGLALVLALVAGCGGTQAQRASARDAVCTSARAACAVVSGYCGSR